MNAVEQNVPQQYKQGIVSGGAADIVYTDLFTGVHGNYLRGSIEASGLDPDLFKAPFPQPARRG